MTCFPRVQDDSPAQQQLAAGILHQLLMMLLDAPAGRCARLCPNGLASVIDICS